MNTPAAARAARRRLGLTQSALAAELDLDRSAIARRETGVAEVRPMYLLALEALRVRGKGNMVLSNNGAAA